jgi:hypothetical protein
MIETVDISTPVGDVTGILDGPAGGQGPAILLAHGAGLGQTHPWMVAMRSQMADAGHQIMTFNYLYTAQGRKAPDRLPKLLDVHEAAAAVLIEEHGSIVLAGKSMGGRVGSHLVAEGRVAAIGLIYLGYPLVAMGKTEPRNVDHLNSIGQPQLFISGTRDRLGPQDLITAVAASVPNGTSEIVESGDHSLVPLKRTGRTLDDSFRQAVDAISDWIDAAF